MQRPIDGDLQPSVSGALHQSDQASITLLHLQTDFAFTPYSTMDDLARYQDVIGQLSR